MAGVATAGVASVILTGAATGAAGGAEWIKSRTTFAYDLAFNGIKNSFVRIGTNFLKEFMRPIIKSSIVGSSGFIAEIIKKYRNE